MLFHPRAIMDILSPNARVRLYLLLVYPCFPDRNRIQLWWVFSKFCNLVGITIAILLLLLPQERFLAVPEISSHLGQKSPCVYKSVGLLIELKLCPELVFLQQLVIEPPPSLTSRVTTPNHSFRRLVSFRFAVEAPCDHSQKGSSDRQIPNLPKTRPSVICLEILSSLSEYLSTE